MWKPSRIQSPFVRTKVATHVNYPINLRTILLWRYIIFLEVVDKVLWNIWLINSVSQKTPLWKQRKASFSWCSAHFFPGYCVRNTEKHSDELKLIFTQTIHAMYIRRGPLPTTVAAQNKIDEEMSEKKLNSRHMLLKIYLSVSINSQT